MRPAEGGGDLDPLPGQLLLPGMPSPDEGPGQAALPGLDDLRDPAPGDDPELAAVASPARRAHRTTPAMNGKPASDHMTRRGQGPVEPLGKGTSEARLRVFVCNFCSTAEVVPWCGQSPSCGHPECAEALAECIGPHRVDDRRFHGQVNVAIVERHLWDRYKETVAVEAR